MAVFVFIKERKNPNHYPNPRRRKKAEEIWGCKGRRQNISNPDKEEQGKTAGTSVSFTHIHNVQINLIQCSAVLCFGTFCIKTLRETRHSDSVIWHNKKCGAI